MHSQWTVNYVHALSFQHSTMVDSFTFTAVMDYLMTLECACIVASTKRRNPTNGIRDASSVRRAYTMGQFQYEYFAIDLCCWTSGFIILSMRFILLQILFITEHPHLIWLNIYQTLKIASSMIWLGFESSYLTQRMYNFIFWNFFDLA